MSVDIGLMSPLGWDYSERFGYITERIAPGEILAQLFDYAKTVIAGAWGKVRKAVKIPIHNFSGDARLVYLLFDQKAVEVSQQLRLRLIMEMGTGQAK